jgi:hypothetical protein
MQKEVSIGANAVNENILSGSAFEFARANSLMVAGVTAAATGTFVTIQTGADIVLEESPAKVSTAFPIIPDEFYYADVAAAGDRLVIRVRNSTGGAIIVKCIVQLTNV